MMRKTLITIALGTAICAAAQQPTQPAPPQGSNWQHVQALPIGAQIIVKARTSHASCNLKSVDADTLTCTQGKPVTFKRIEITSIKLPRRTRSTLILAGAGAGLGAVVVKTVATAGFNGFFNGKAKGSVYAGGIGLGAVVFGPIGYFGDPTRSTVYKSQ